MLLLGLQLGIARVGDLQKKLLYRILWLRYASVYLPLRIVVDLAGEFSIVAVLLLFLILCCTAVEVVRTVLVNDGLLSDLINF